MYYFFAGESQIGDSAIRLEGTDVNHIRNVLRMKPGDEVLVGDQEGRDYRCRIEEIGKDAVELSILERDLSVRELPSHIYLFQGLPKGDKMESVIQKNVELGVWEIIPVSTKRSVVKLDEKRARAKTARWQEIARSAAKQSKRGRIPSVAPVMDFRQALAYAAKLDVKLMPYECEEGMGRTRSLLKSIRPGQSIGIFIGPEGGFDEAEAEAAREAGFETLTLGRRILRTETAGMMLVSVLGFLLEEE